jgi:hypothetical protein
MQPARRQERMRSGHRPARTRHPDAVALDAAIEIAAVLVLLEEGLERVEEGHAALVEHALFDNLSRPDSMRENRGGRRGMGAARRHRC